MKKILIGLMVLILAMTVVSAMEVGDCYVIESGILAGKTVCYVGTVTITAGEVIEEDFEIEEPNWAWGLFKNGKIH